MLRLRNYPTPHRCPSFLLEAAFAHTDRPGADCPLYLQMCQIHVTFQHGVIEYFYCLSVNRGSVKAPVPQY
jgi:hypothetical protein